MGTSISTSITDFVWMASQMRLEVGKWGYAGISVVVAHKYSDTNTLADGESHTDTHTRTQWQSGRSRRQHKVCLCVYVCHFLCAPWQFKNANNKPSSRAATPTVPFHHQQSEIPEHRFVLLHSGRGIGYQGLTETLLTCYMFRNLNIK